MVIFAPTASDAFQKEVDIENAEMSDEEFREILREREMAKEQYRQELMERGEKKPPSNIVKVRVHQPGPDGKMRVVTGGEISKDEHSRKDFKRVHAMTARAVGAVQPGQVPGEGGVPTAAPSPKRNVDDPGQVNWIFWSVLGVLGFGFWVSKSYDFG